MKTVPVHEAVGMVLCHDLTQIIPGQFKGRAFKRGHIVRYEDIPRLLNMGKEYLYVLDLSEGLIHEDEAAVRLARAAAGAGIDLSEPKEGKVGLIAKYDGLLKINVGVLTAINEIEEIIFATLHSNQYVTAGKTVGGTRVIPLTIDERKINAAEEICRRNAPLAMLKPFKSYKAGIVITGSEVYRERITDKFSPVVNAKFAKFGSKVMPPILVPDSSTIIAQAVHTLLAEGAEIIAVTGGMSVDPDDVSPAGIREAGAEIVTYGAPTLPGAMFMLAYLGNVPVIGLPGCVMYHSTTVFDLVLPRLLAGERLTKQDILNFAHGGLCVNCEVCRYPDCGFGKGC